MASLRCISYIAIIALITSCLLIVIGIIGIALGPHILQTQINKQLPLTPDSDQLDSWSTPPVPIYFQFWLWECVNPAEVLTGGKPSIVQRGPFTYLEHRTKSGVYFNENYTVTYRQPISYTFLRNMSADDESVQITMVNTPIVTIVSLIRNQTNRTQEIFNFVKDLFNESLFVEHTAREWIWGYEDRLLKAAKSIPILKDLIPDDHFGYFYGSNGTDDGLYTVFTGKRQRSKRHFH
jgi:lysosome membrane protein 2